MKPLLVLFLTASAARAAEPPRLAVTLVSAETAALSNSSRLAAAEQDLAAAQGRADAQWGALLPRVTLDGSYRYVTEVPSLILGPGKTQPFGDHRTTSYGIGAAWTLWDQGSLRSGWRSQQARARSKEEERSLVRRQVLLGVRLAYFQLQLAREQERLVADSLRVVHSQYTDIDSRRAAGAASRIDSLSAHQEELDRRRQLSVAQAERAASLRELFTLTGASAPETLAAADLDLALDPLSSAPAFAAAATAPFDEAHPQLRALSEQAEAGRRSADAVGAGNWPRVQLTAKSSYDYPNGPVLETVQQNAVGLTASLPLFEGGRTSKDASAERSAASAADARRRQAEADLRRDWGKARDMLDALRTQTDLDRQAVAETEELARLVYAAYSAGSRTFLEVQSANLRALQAKVAAARTQAQTSIQLAVLDSLTVRPQ